MLSHLKYIISVIIFIYCSISGYSQDFIIRGYVIDSLSGEYLSGANVYDTINHTGAVTNKNGFFLIRSDNRNISVRVSYIGYHEKNILVENIKDTTLNIYLVPTPEEIKEVTILSNRERITRFREGLSRISPKTVSGLPMLLGEKDPLKALQYLPGIKMGAEGTSSLYVRGGGPDQNLLLVDDIPVYNPGHLFGFVSILDHNCINNINIIKGGFPARYGGRLSSVLDVSLASGDSAGFGGNCSLGIVSAGLSVKGPVTRHGVNVAFCARRSYIDFFHKWIRLPEMDIPDYNFDDILSKIEYNRNNHHISFTFINNFDRVFERYEESYTDESGKYGEELDNTLRWGNRGISLGYNTLINNRLSLHASVCRSSYVSDRQEKISATYTNFDTGISDTSIYQQSLKSDIQNIILHSNIDLKINNNYRVKAGIQQTFATLNPNTSMYIKEDDESYNQDLSARENPYTSDIYVENIFSLLSRLNFNIGMRYSLYISNNKPVSYPEPRLALTCAISKAFLAKVAYSKTHQYVHLLTSSKIGLARDFWIPATRGVKPGASDQYNISFLFLRGNYSLSVEAYYKDMNNLYEYKDGAVYANDTWEELIERGRGRAYGIEFLFEKSFGRTTGWIGYTLSRSDRKFETINYGKTFPYRYDRTHDISIVILHKFNEKINCSVDWVYGTGNAFTFPTALIWGNLEYIGSRNNLRAPAYHRLDFNVNFIRKRRIITHDLSVGIYNLYNRTNPFYLQYISDENKIYVVGLFPILPFVKYTIGF